MYASPREENHIPQHTLPARYKTPMSRFYNTGNEFQLSGSHNARQGGALSAIRIAKFNNAKVAPNMKMKLKGSS